MPNQLPPPRLREEDMALLDLQAETREALAARPTERVSRALTVLPHLMAFVDHVCLYRHDFHAVRAELTAAVRHFREAVWEAQKMHPEVTYRSAQVHAALNAMNPLIDRLERLLHSDPAPSEPPT